jgi:hypothetical protein
MNLDMTLRELLQAHIGDLTPQPVPPAMYDSRSNLPPGCSRRAFNQRCKATPGAHKIGHVWHCERAAYFEYRSCRNAYRLLDARFTQVDAKMTANALSNREQLQHSAARARSIVSLSFYTERNT